MINEVKNIPIEDVKPDVNQPRKNFSAEHIAGLGKSFKKFGVMTPVFVQKEKDGTYIIQDGECRWRALKELGEKTAPCIIGKPLDERERLMRQYQIQELKKGWSSIEKANFIGQYADEYGLSIKDVAADLCESPRLVTQYKEYFTLCERGEFERNQIPIAMARYFNSVTSLVKKIYEGELEREFTKDDKSAIELRLISAVKNDELVNMKDFAKLKDAFNQDPKMIDKFIKGKVTVMKAYIDSDAKRATAVRKLNQTANHVETSLNTIMDFGLNDEVVEDSVIRSRLKRIRNNINRIIGDE